jgi:hypothetical protein
MNSWLGRASRILVLVACACLLAGNSGCSGTDTREQADDVVEEMTGKKDLDRYHQMKGELNEIQQRQSKKYDQLKN